MLFFLIDLLSNMGIKSMPTDKKELLWLEPSFEVLRIVLGLFPQSFAILHLATLFQSQHQVALRRLITNVLRCTKLTTAKQMP